MTSHVNAMINHSILIPQVENHIEDGNSLQDLDFVDVAAMKVEQHETQDEIANGHDAARGSDSPAIAMSMTEKWEKELLQISKVVHLCTAGILQI